MGKYFKYNLRTRLRNECYIFRQSFKLAKGRWCRSAEFK